MDPEPIPDPAVVQVCMPPPAGFPLDAATFKRVVEDYRKRFGHSIVCADANGNLVFGMPECKLFPCLEDCRNCRKLVLEQTIRSGRSQAFVCHENYVIWGVPLMVNQRTHGALIAVGVPLAAGPGGSSRHHPPEYFESACNGLVDLAVEHNLTNRDFLDARRALAGDDSGARKRTLLAASLTMTALRPRLAEWELQLEQAIRRDKATGAGKALDAIFELLAMAAGHSPEMIHGYCVQLISRIFQFGHETTEEYANLLQMEGEALERMLKHTEIRTLHREVAAALQAVVELSQRSRRASNSAPLNRALSYIEKHFDETLTRRHVARACGISEGALSRLINSQTGRSFSDVVKQYRVDRAAQLLRTTEKSLLTVAMETGFSDQSYFGRIFRQHYGQTPDQFRRFCRGEG